MCAPRAQWRLRVLNKEAEVRCPSVGGRALACLTLLMHFLVQDVLISLSELELGRDRWSRAAGMWHEVWAWQSLQDWGVVIVGVGGWIETGPL